MDPRDHQSELILTLGIEVEFLEQVNAFIFFDYVDFIGGTPREQPARVPYLLGSLVFVPSEHPELNLRITKVLDALGSVFLEDVFKACDA